MTAVHYTVRSMVVKLKPGTAAETAVECAITGVTENESHSEVTGQTACPDGTFTDVGPSTWSVQVDYNVKHTPTSLHRLLREHVGQPATLSIEPDPVGDPGRIITYTVPAIVAGGAGMTVGSTAVASVVLPLEGMPTYTDPPVVP